MIIFRTLRYKNLLSSGNNWTKINFTDTKSTLVVGHNGAGKSTMLDALSF
jgi:DNA repair exonuclease SbcCD ATPase subunit